MQEQKYVDVQNFQPVKEKYSVVELFAGAGGLALGLEQAGFHDVGLVEKDKSSCETLRINRPRWNVIEEDIVKVAEKGIKTFLPADVYEIDLLSGGYPCQTFSHAGKRAGLADTRGTMFYYYAKILEELQPKMFLAENVRGLVTHNKGATLTTMIEVFSSLGYIVKWKVLKAVDYNVAQKRERIMIVGVRKDLPYCNEYLFPQPYETKIVLKDVLHDVPLSAGATYSEAKKKVLDLVPPGGYWKDLPTDVAKKYLGKSFYAGGGKTGMAKRLSWDEPSLTLTCSPVQKQTERCHPDQTRPLTVREYARIQSFPDEWAFSGSTTNNYRQIGNAVPVNLARAVGLSIVACLDLNNKQQV